MWHWFYNFRKRREGEFGSIPRIYAKLRYTDLTLALHSPVKRCWKWCIYLSRTPELHTYFCWTLYFSGSSHWMVFAKALPISIAKYLLELLGNEDCSSCAIKRVLKGRKVSRTDSALISSLEREVSNKASRTLPPWGLGRQQKYCLWTSMAGEASKWSPLQWESQNSLKKTVLGIFL